MNPSRTPPSEPGDYVFTPDEGKALRVQASACFGSVHFYSYCKRFFGRSPKEMPPGWWQREPEPQGYVPPPVPRVEIADGTVLGDEATILFVDGVAMVARIDGEWCDICASNVDASTNRRPYQEPQT